MTQIIRNVSEAVLDKIDAKGVLTDAVCEALGVADVAAAPEGFENVFAVVKTKDKPTDVVITAIPTVSAILEASDGQGYIEDKIRTQLLNKTISTVRNGSDNYPTTVMDFIKARASAVAGSGFLQPYKDVAKGVVELLRGKGLSIDVTTLRKALESNQFASAMYPSIAASVWDSLLNKLALKDVEENDGTGELFESWLENRYEEKEVDMSDLDLSDLV